MSNQENIDERVLKITGGAFIEDDLLNDTDYILTAPITTYSTGEKRSNQDGSYNLNFKARITGAIELTGETKTIHGKKKGSQSALLRSLIMGKAIADGKDGETYYSIVINKILNNLDDVIIFLKDK